MKLPEGVHGEPLGNGANRADSPRRSPIAVLRALVRTMTWEIRRIIS